MHAGRHRLAGLILLLYLPWGCVPVLAQSADPQFQPTLEGVEFTSRQIRPGDQFAMTIKFGNAGSKPARGDYRVFVHFEAPQAKCENIVFQADHEPTLPTTMWEPGKTVADGPHILTTPTDRPEQEYFVHIGVFDQTGTGERLLQTYEGGKITVSSQAPASDSFAPQALSEEQVDARRKALAGRISADRAASLQADHWRFDLDRETGAWTLTDKFTGVLWSSCAEQPAFARVTMARGSRRYVSHLDRLTRVQEDDRHIRVEAIPVVDGKPSGVTLTFTFERMDDPDGLRVSYEARDGDDWKVVRVRPLHNALWVTDADDGVVYVPHRLGIELPADEGLPGHQQWTTYNNISMAMCGAVKQGSALLVNWDTVDTHLSVDTTWPDAPLVPGRRMRALSLDMDAPGATCTIHPMGPGGYVQIAHAYRILARAKGWLATWADRRAEFPSVDRIFGAANFKPFVLSRVMPSSRFAVDGKERVHLSYTFDEVAQCAEHWKNDLGIDRASVVLAGWINGGYDVRHPDPLPAAPECGGNEGMKKAFDRIKDCGYLVGGHDNYQDMYEDAPSWGEEWLNKGPRGTPKRGGNWNGGQAWQVCAIKQVELAARERTNLPEIARLFDPTIYFIDTVFAWPLVTCEDPAHPMARADDLRWKTELCMLAKKHFGLFGSEEGREWAVPCSDYLEGIFGHQTDSPPGAVIPLFPLVYSDCVQIMTHQGNRISAGDNKKMADHILFAEMHLPRFGNHLYWKDVPPRGAPVIPLPATVSDLGDRRAQITFRWQVTGKIDRDYFIFAHFVHEAAERAEKIAYQSDHSPVTPTSQWQPGTVVEDGPYTVEVPPEFNGTSRILVGMTHNGGRATLSDCAHSNQRYCVGQLQINDEGIRFIEPTAAAAMDIWSRADGGWAQDLCATDRVIKNTWEVLSPLNLITAERPMTGHEFLTEDRLLQRTRFGDLAITVAYDKAHEFDGNAVPAYGFVIESPTFIAFCATRYNGIRYETPTLFTARSLDGKPIAQSSRVRVYHGFGDPRIKLGDRVFEVQAEEVVSPG